MSKRKKDQRIFWFKLMSIFLMGFSLLGILGNYGFLVGKWIYFLFTSIMGSLAWAGPFLFFVSAILLWIHSSNLASLLASQGSGTGSVASSTRTPRNRRKIQTDSQSSDQLEEVNFKPDIVLKGISLPEGKLVSLRGFNAYFASPEWVEMKDKDTQKAEEMEEIGDNFPSYFGTGESFSRHEVRKLKVLKGLDDYIEQVDQEQRLERAIPWQEGTKPKSVEKSTQKPLQFSSVFKSQKEQEEFLAQFKEKKDGNSIKQETLEVETLEEGSSSIEEAEEIVQIVVESISKTEIDSTTTLDSNEELLKIECPPQELQESEDAPVAATSSLKPDYAGQEVAKAFDQIPKDTLKIVENPQVVNSVVKVNHWKFPEFDLLDPVPQRIIIQDTETSIQLEKVLLDFGVKAKVIRVTRGPVITRYELAPAPGVKISKIVNLSDDIALSLAARDVRIEAPIPGKAAIGIEVPNKQARSVPFREVLETTNFGQYPSKLKVALGKDIADQPIIADLIKMPHLLVAGATGSGKSVCITTIINSLLYNVTPDEVKFLLVDPKMVELSQYNGIPHLLAPVVVDPKKAASALKWIVKEMENRYELFAAAGVRDIERYNKSKAEESVRNTPALPFIVVIIDELADLMMVAAGEVEEAVCRLAQMARAAGIHLVIATQRPSVDVITGVIKANIPSRISFAVSSQIDSRTILDATGAEKLLGRGDMLYSPLGVNKALRVQGCLVTDDEVQRVITHWKGLGRPEYLDPEHLFAETSVKNEESNGQSDALFIDAGQLFIRTNIASVSFLQRKLKLGYTRAARIMDMLQEQGVVGTYEGSKPRQVLLTLEEFNERFG